MKMTHYKTPNAIIDGNVAVLLYCMHIIGYFLFAHKNMMLWIFVTFRSDF